MPLAFLALLLLFSALIARTGQASVICNFSELLQTPTVLGYTSDANKGRDAFFWETLMALLRNREGLAKRLGISAQRMEVHTPPINELNSNIGKLREEGLLEKNGLKTVEESTGDFAAQFLRGEVPETALLGSVLIPSPVVQRLQARLSFYLSLAQDPSLSDPRIQSAVKAALSQEQTSIENLTNVLARVASSGVNVLARHAEDGSSAESVLYGSLSRSASLNVLHNQLKAEGLDVSSAVSSRIDVFEKSNPVPPDADFNQMIDGLQKRLRDLH